MPPKPSKTSGKSRTLVRKPKSKANVGPRASKRVAKRRAATQADLQAANAGQLAAAVARESQADYQAFKKKVDQATIGYYCPRLDQLFPGLEFRIRPVRQSGVEVLKQEIFRGYNGDHVITVYESLDHAKQYKYPLFKKTKFLKDLALGTGTIPWECDPHNGVRKLWYIDGNHRMAAIEQLLQDKTKPFFMDCIPRVKVMDISNISVPPPYVCRSKYF